MTKAKLVNKIKGKLRVDGKKESVAEMMELIFETISEEMKKGESISIVNFGTFSSTHREEREYNVPNSTKTVTKKAGMVPKFKFSKNFKNNF